MKYTIILRQTVNMDISFKKILEDNINVHDLELTKDLCIATFESTVCEKDTQIEALNAVFDLNAKHKKDYSRVYLLK